MKQKNKFSIILLALVVTVSGCADSNQEESSSTEPLQINDFSASPNPVPADRTARLNIELENTGDSDARQVAFRLFGPTWGQNDEDSDGWRTGNREAMNTTESRTQLVSERMRAPSENSPSIPENPTVSLTAPSYEEGRTVDDTFSMELFYQYQTRANTELSVMTEERRRETGTTQSQPEVDVSSGPIQMDVQGTVPKIQYEDSTNEEICVVVTNEGPGEPFMAETPSGIETDVSGAKIGGEGTRVYDVNQSNRGRLTLKIEDVSNIEFTPDDTAVAEGKDGETSIAVIQLINGERVQCFEWSVDGALQQQEQNVNLQVTADYGYTKETSTSLTVEGRP